MQQAPEIQEAHAIPAQAKKRKVRDNDVPLPLAVKRPRHEETASVILTSEEVKRRELRRAIALRKAASSPWAPKLPWAPRLGLNPLDYGRQGQWLLGGIRTADDDVPVDCPAHLATLQWEQQQAYRKAEEALGMATVEEQAQPLTPAPLPTRIPTAPSKVTSLLGTLASLVPGLSQRFSTNRDKSTAHQADAIKQRRKAKKEKMRREEEEKKAEAARYEKSFAEEVERAVQERLKEHEAAEIAKAGMKRKRSSPPATTNPKSPSYGTSANHSHASDRLGEEEAYEIAEGLLRPFSKKICTYKSDEAWDRHILAGEIGDPHMARPYIGPMFVPPNMFKEPWHLELTKRREALKSNSAFSHLITIPDIVVDSGPIASVPPAATATVITPAPKATTPPAALPPPPTALPHEVSPIATDRWYESRYGDLRPYIAQLDNGTFAWPEFLKNPGSSSDPKTLGLSQQEKNGLVVPPPPSKKVNTIRNYFKPVPKPAMMAGRHAVPELTITPPTPPTTSTVSSLETVMSGSSSQPLQPEGNRIVPPTISPKIRALVYANHTPDEAERFSNVFVADFAAWVADSAPSGPH